MRPMLDPLADPNLRSAPANACLIRTPLPI